MRYHNVDALNLKESFDAIIIGIDMKKTTKNFLQLSFAYSEFTYRDLHKIPRVHYLQRHNRSHNIRWMEVATSEQISVVLCQQHCIMVRWAHIINILRETNKWAKCLLYTISTFSNHFQQNITQSYSRKKVYKWTNNSVSSRQMDKFKIIFPRIRSIGTVCITILQILMKLVKNRLSCFCCATQSQNFSYETHGSVISLNSKFLLHLKQNKCLID